MKIVKKRTIEEIAGQIALGTFLSFYNKNESYEITIEKLQLNSMDIAIWEAFENDDPEDVAEYIDILKREIVIGMKEYNEKNL